MATLTPAQLVAPQLLAATDTAIYTAPAATTVKIGRAVFCNTSASLVTITVGITTGGILGASTTMISSLSIPANETYVSPELAGATFPANSEVRAYASVADVVCVEISGLLIT